MAEIRTGYGEQRTTGRRRKRKAQAPAGAKGPVGVNRENTKAQAVVPPKQPPRGKRGEPRETEADTLRRLGRTGRPLPPQEIQYGGYRTYEQRALARKLFFQDLKKFHITNAMERENERRAKANFVPNPGKIYAAPKGYIDALSGRTPPGFLEKNLKESGFGLPSLDVKGVRSAARLGDMLLQAGPGVVHAAQALEGDALETQRTGRLTTERTGPIAKAMAKGFQQDLGFDPEVSPAENPERSALTVLGLATLGTGTAIRGVAGLGAAREAAAAGAGTRAALSRAMTRPTHEGGSVLHRPAPGELTVHVPHRGETGETHVKASPGKHLVFVKNGVWKEEKTPLRERDGEYSIRVAKGGAWEVNGNTYTARAVGEVKEGKPKGEGGSGAGSGGGQRFRRDPDTGELSMSGGYKKVLQEGQIKAPPGKKFVQIAPQKYKLVDDYGMRHGRQELTAAEGVQFAKTVNKQGNATYREIPTAGKDFHYLQPDNPLLRPLNKALIAGIQKYADDPDSFMGRAMMVPAARSLGSALIREGHHEARTPGGASYGQKAFVDEAQRLGLIGESGLAKSLWTKRAVEDSRLHSNRVTDVMQTVNRPFRFFGVYFRPAYFMTNYPGNIAMGAMIQGSKVVPNFHKAGIAGRLTNKRMGKEFADAMDVEMGTTRTMSYYIGGEKKIGKPFLGSKKAGQFEERWTGTVSRLTDRQFRHASWYYRAKEMGYKTDAQMKELMHGDTPKLVRDRAIVRRRANKDAVDFDSLTPYERDLVDFLYFYPWVSRSTLWTGRTIVNRPVKSAALAQLGSYADEEQRRRMGPVPGWLKGWLPDAEGKTARNISPVSALSTPGQIMQYAAGGRAGRRALAEEFGTPALQLLTTPAGSEIPRNIIRSTGILQIPFGGPSKTFPESSVATRTRGYVFGAPFNPRVTDPGVVLSQAKREMKPTDKVKTTYGSARRQIIEEAIRVGLAPKGATKLPEELRRAYNRKQMRYMNRARIAEKGGKNALHKGELFLADIELLKRKGVWPKSEYDKAKKWAEGKLDDEAWDWNSTLRQLDEYFNYTDIIKEWKADLRENGGQPPSN